MGPNDLFALMMLSKMQREEAAQRLERVVAAATDGCSDEIAALDRRCGDATVEAVRADLLRRSEIGVAKYGTTVAGNPLPLREWLQHAYEEALDMAVYLKRAMAEVGAQAAKPAANCGECDVSWPCYSGASACIRLRL